MFTKVRHGIECDVSGRNAHLSETHKSNGVMFSVEDKDDGSFVVYRRGPGLAGSVSFAIFGSCIKAIDAIGGTLEVTIGMNDNGRCMLRVNGPDGISELEMWQFRKKTLESLFFWTSL